MTRDHDPGGLRDQATDVEAGPGVHCEAGHEVGAAYTSFPETEKKLHLMVIKLKGFACRKPIFDQ